MTPDNIVRWSRSLVVPAIALALSGCMVQKVDVKLERTRIETVSSDVLSGTDPIVPGVRKRQEFVALRFDISSDVDFRDYFKDRLLQVRCEVDGEEGGFGYGPFHDGRDLSRKHIDRSVPVVNLPAADGRYTYTVYGSQHTKYNVRLNHCA